MPKCFGCGKFILSGGFAGGSNYCMNCESKRWKGNIKRKTLDDDFPIKKLR